MLKYKNNNNTKIGVKYEHISKLPKKVNEWLITGQRLGLINEKQKNDFIAKYISLRQAGRPEVKFRETKKCLTR